MRKQHVVVLSELERARLHTLIGQGSAPARALTHARILLKANQGEAGPGWSDRGSPPRWRSTTPRWPGCASSTPPGAWRPR